MEQLSSPDENLTITFAIGDDGENRDMYRQCPQWSLKYKGRTILLPSRLGLQLDGQPSLLTHFEITDVVRNKSDSTWHPVCGEYSEIRDHYNELDVRLRETIQPNRTLKIMFRAYDTGAAFYYSIPDDDDWTDVDIWREATRFSFPLGCEGWVTRTAQGAYRRTPIEEVGPECERPLLVCYPDDTWAAIGEAGQYDYPRMRLQTDRRRPHTLAALLNGNVHRSAPFSSPWRYVIVGDRAIDIPQRNSLSLNLAPPCRIENTEWIVPGTAIRETTLTTVGAYRCIDFAVERGIRYVLFDGGWYGHPLDEAVDATTVGPWLQKIADPDNYPGMDMQEILRYANAAGVGIWLYVDQHALERQLETIVRLYAEWGVVGIKFGFVYEGPQGWSRWLIDAVELCAKHRLMVDIHDEYRPTGMQRTWPNMVNVEGIRGNEEFPDAEHNATLPFTRFVDGLADYTICIYSDRLKTRRTQQLAMAVCFFAPFEMVYWYDKPEMYNGEPELAFLDEIPTVWDDTRILAGTPGDYVITARRSGTDWYVGAINGPADRVVCIAFDFIDRVMEATIYRDGDGDGHSDGDGESGTNNVVIERRPVNPGEEIELTLMSAGGVVIEAVPQR